MFVAVIDNLKHKSIWSKAIISLAAISDSIKFVIQKDSLSISAVNSAKTSNGEVIFKKSFFYEYTAEFEFDDMIEGYEIEGDKDAEAHERENGNTPYNESFSFVVNARHLYILFRYLDILDLQYICLKVHWTHIDVDERVKYKLLIEIKTQQEILKKFQAAFQPVYRNRVDVVQQYREQLKQHHGLASTTNYIKVEQVIFKEFLAMVPSTTEDFKIEQKTDTIQFCAFTKLIMKDKEYLKQPMSVTISIKMEELLDTNFNDKEVDGVMFRLKDFKNFINLINSFSDGNKSNDLNYLTDDYLEVMFKQPGDPIVFELNNNQHIVIQFVQITNSIENSGLDAGGGANKGVLKAHVFHPISTPETAHQTPKVTNGHTQKPIQDDEVPLFLPQLSQEIPGPDLDSRLEKEQGRKRSHSSKNVGSHGSVLQDTDYESDGEMDEYGPTQGVKKPKSIFD